MSTTVYTFITVFQYLYHSFGDSAASLHAACTCRLTCKNMVISIISYSDFIVFRLCYDQVWFTVGCTGAPYAGAPGVGAAVA